MNRKEISKKKSSEFILENYQEILRDIRSILEKAKSRAYRAVDNIRVQTYWQIGERIVRAELEHKDRADYGDRLVDRLAEDIGLNKRDIYRIIQFFRYYPIMTAVPSQLSWSHYIELIQISDPSKRKFYESRAIGEAWSTRDLRKQVKSGLYEHILKEGKLTTMTSQALKPLEPEEVFKDVYNFEFLELKKDYKEEELKSALLDKVEDFLREFGPEFFVGRREVPVLIGGNYDRVDLELFHAGLLCYILVEIKIEKFKHSHVSQMYSYLNWYKENKMRKGQQLPIGLIICKTKDEETVHYALGDLKKEIFVSEYITNLPTEKEIKEELEK
jgi:predicted nuclease of restriction endonuclease-like (RecB) superfamily